MPQPARVGCPAARERGAPSRSQFAGPGTKKCLSKHCFPRAQAVARAGDARLALAGDHGSLRLGVERPHRAAGPAPREEKSVGDRAERRASARHLWPRPPGPRAPGAPNRRRPSSATKRRPVVPHVFGALASFRAWQASSTFGRLDRLWQAIEERKAGTSITLRMCWAFVRPVGADARRRPFLDPLQSEMLSIPIILDAFRTARLLAKGTDKCAQKAGLGLGSWYLLFRFSSFLGQGRRGSHRSLH